MRSLWIVALTTAWGCNATSHSVDAAPPPPGDGGEVRETCAGTDPGSVNFFGEPCTEAPFPAATTCHTNVGWCVAGICRPQCSSGCRRCTDGVTRITDRGACYCSPN